MNLRLHIQVQKEKSISKHTHENVDRNVATALVMIAERQPPQMAEYEASASWEIHRGEQ